jgi:DNA-binding MarR family transcriptional regulator
MQPEKNIGRMLGALHRNGRNYFYRELAPFGLGGGVHSFLMVLYERDGLSQNELSAILNFDKAHATRAVQKLLKLGFITREQDEKDRRLYHIYLTEKARAHQHEIDNVLRTWMNVITAGLSKDELETLNQLLEKMTDNARQFMKQQKCSKESST